MAVSRTSKVCCHSQLLDGCCSIARISLSFRQFSETIIYRKCLENNFYVILLRFEDCYCNLVTADDNLEGVGDFHVKASNLVESYLQIKLDSVIVTKLNKYLDFKEGSLNHPLFGKFLYKLPH